MLLRWRSGLCHCKNGRIHTQNCDKESFFHCGLTERGFMDPHSPSQPKFWSSFLLRFYFPERALVRLRFQLVLHQIFSIPNRSAPSPDGSPAVWDRTARPADRLLVQGHISVESNILAPELGAIAQHPD